MTGEVRQNMAGILLRGADGAVYFIPEGRMADFQLSKQEAARAQQLLEDGAEVRGFTFESPQLTVLGSVLFTPVGGGNDTFTHPFGDTVNQPLGDTFTEPFRGVS